MLVRRLSRFWAAEHSRSKLKGELPPWTVDQSVVAEKIKLAFAGAKTVKRSS